MNPLIFRAWLRARARTNERGANLVEYLLLLAFIAIIVIVALQTLGGTVSTHFSSANNVVGSSIG
ncbi:MAG TPA: Flp family type IVb pilin [Acidimicrobiia bacterium]|jgi:Flp pilus assembly pilin Flp